jgi:hypothetical protein
LLPAVLEVELARSDAGSRVLDVDPEDLGLAQRPARDLGPVLADHRVGPAGTILGARSGK